MPIRLQFPLSPAQVELLGAALAHAHDGRPVFPCNPSNKKPFTKKGFKDATRDQTQIEQWWRHQFRGAAIGMPTGSASGLWVTDLDVDPSKNLDGITAFAELEKRYGKTPATMAATTPRGGQHLFWSWQGGISNSTGKIAPGVDVRGDGGYVLLPPSVRADGVAYAWRPDCGALAAAPAWLIKEAMGRKEERQPGSSATPAPDWRKLAKGVEDGCRNASITRLTGLLLARRVDAIVVLELMQAFNEARCSPPLATAEVTRIVDSIANREIAKRQAR